MIKGIRINHSGDGQKIAAISGFVFNPMGDQTIMRVTFGGNAVGGVVIADWTGYGGSCCMHVAGWEPHWLSRNLLFVAFDYPFRQLGVKRIFAQMRASRMGVVNFNRKLGFVPRYLIEGAYPDDDMLISELMPENCRFLDLVPTTEPDDG